MCLAQNLASRVTPREIVGAALTTVCFWPWLQERLARLAVQQKDPADGKVNTASISAAAFGYTWVKTKDLIFETVATEMGTVASNLSACASLGFCVCVCVCVCVSLCVPVLCHSLLLGLLLSVIQVCQLRKWYGIHLAWLPQQFIEVLPCGAHI